MTSALAPLSENMRLLLQALDERSGSLRLRFELGARRVDLMVILLAQIVLTITLFVLLTSIFHLVVYVSSLRIYTVSEFWLASSMFPLANFVLSQWAPVVFSRLNRPCYYRAPMFFPINSVWAPLSFAPSHLKRLPISYEGVQD